MKRTASEAPNGGSGIEVRFDPDTGLVPAIVQSAEDGGVRMLAHMDAEALERTLRTGRATFFSRSRGRLWEKGETSGNRLDVVEIRADCDGDALLVRAVPRGPTCHTGRERCFDAGGAARPSGAAEAAGRALDAGPEETPGPAAGGPSAGASPRGGERLAELLVELEALIARGDRDRPADSYTTRLLEGGPAAVAQKVGEEAIETSLAAVAEPGRLAEESADLLYHLLVLWRTVGLEAADVAAVLRGRRERS